MPGLFLVYIQIATLANRSFFIIEAVFRKCSVKTVFLKILQNS